MTGRFEKAKLQGYSVNYVEPPQTSSATGWDAATPEGHELLSPGPGGLWETEDAAWLACDNHRMFGHVLGSRGELRAAGYTVNASKGASLLPPYHQTGWQWNHDASGAGSAGYASERAAWEGAAHHLREGGQVIHPTPEAVRLETRRVVVLPTQHLTLATCAMLAETPLEAWPVAGGRIPYGFYIYAHDEGHAQEAPADLRAVCYWANGAGFDYIQFDHDGGEPAPGLPIFDHDSTDAQLMGRAAGYLERFAEFNNEPEGGDCRSLLAELRARAA